MAARSAVLSLYKQTLQCIKRVPQAEKRDTMLREARTEYRKNAAEQDAAKIDALVKKADSKLSFLKMITPRRAVTTGNGGRYVVFEGEIVEGASAKRKSGFKDTRPDPDDIARHERLLKRQYFMDRNTPLRKEEVSKVVPWSD